MALRLGKTVKELLASLDSAELTEWLAYFHLEKAGPPPENAKSLKAKLAHRVVKARKP